MRAVAAAVMAALWALAAMVAGHQEVSITHHDGEEQTVMAPADGSPIQIQVPGGPVPGGSPLIITASVDVRIERECICFVPPLFYFFIRVFMGVVV